MEIDRKTLKALAADTRLDILKSLGKRRKTPSELSKELKLATSTVVEHLNKLEKAELVKREETGHKWIYYNLTKKGSSLVKPKVPTQFIIVLSLCVLVVSIGFIYYYVNYTSLGAVAKPDMLTVPSTEKALEETRMPTVTGGVANITNFTFNTEKGSCHSGELEEQIEIIGGDNKIIFSGLVITPDPCHELEESYSVSGSDITIEITSKSMVGVVCIICVGSVPFDGYIEINEGHYNIKIIHNERTIGEEEVDVS